MDLFKQSIILTRKHNRYGGDHDNILALVVDERNVVYLYSSAEPTINITKMAVITSCPKYGQWLIHNSMDLIELLHDSYPHNWYNDRTVPDGRKKEFIALLTKLNK